jgi:hypothetical protein
MRTSRFSASTTSISFRFLRSITMPPSLVLRPLMPWPPLRMPNGSVECFRANNRASRTSSTVRGRSTSPGAPPRMYVERTPAYAVSPGSTAVSRSDSGSSS